MKMLNRFQSSIGGFTLIEVMIVAVIVGVVATLAVPGFQDAYDRQSFRSGYKEMVNTLKVARSNAIANKQPYGVYFDAQTMAITLFENSSGPETSDFDGGDSTISVDTLPDLFEWMYADVENSAIVFRPNGSAQLTGYCNIYMAGETDGMMAYFSTNILASTGRINSYSSFYSW
jgi:prepilin-type N-terminal cleavage/methylation domain-containing protein